MPRRSNGCETCKRRKVKCDEAKPTCERCNRQGYQCEGYSDQLPLRRRSPTFRDQTQRVAAKAEASYAKGGSSSRGSVPARKLSQVREDEHPTLLLSSNPRTSRLPPPASMDNSRERRTQLLSIFVETYLPHASDQIETSHYSYMYILHDILGQHPAIPSAVDALCLYVAGKSFGDEDVVAKSKTIYGAALSRLAQNLERTRLFAPTGTMAAIVILAWCELNLGDSGNTDAWENHLIGASTLLESFEPSVWDTNEGRLILQAVRFMLTCTGILNRRAVVFTQLKWQDVISGSEDAEFWVQLMNHAAQIPGLLEDTDMFITSTTISSKIGDLLNRSFQLRAHMMQWYAALQETSPPDAAVLVPVETQSWWEATPYDSSFPLVYQFSSCRQNYLRVQYWSFMLALSKNTLRLYDSGYILWKTGYPSRETMEEETVSHAIDAARCIAASFDPDSPPVSRFNAAFVIKVCGDTFCEYRLVDKYNWCKAMSGKLEQRGFCMPGLMQLGHIDVAFDSSSYQHHTMADTSGFLD